MRHCTETTTETLKSRHIRMEISDSLQSKRNKKCRGVVGHLQHCERCQLAKQQFTLKFGALDELLARTNDRSGRARARGTQLPWDDRGNI
jgi:hypothetical protein